MIPPKQGNTVSYYALPLPVSRRIYDWLQLNDKPVASMYSTSGTVHKYISPDYQVRVLLDSNGELVNIQAADV